MQPLQNFFLIYNYLLFPHYFNTQKDASYQVWSKLRCATNFHSRRKKKFESIQTVFLGAVQALVSSRVYLLWFGRQVLSCYPDRTTTFQSMVQYIHSRTPSLQEMNGPQRKASPPLSRSLFMWQPHQDQARGS
jgi:hypothetical protein